MNNEDIKQQIRQDSIRNANHQGINYEEDPAWISATSWWIGGIIGVICLVGTLASGGKEDPGTTVLIGIMSGGILGLLAKGISYAILIGMCQGGKIVKKGAIVAANKGSEIFDSTATTIAQKVTSAVETGKAKAEVSLEKQKLKERMQDLELQRLQKRVRQLEEELSPKREGEEMSKFKEAVRAAWKQEDMETLQKLLTENPDFDDIELEGGVTLLMVACAAGAVEVVQYLIQKGANVNAQSNDKENPCSPMLCTCLTGNVDILKELIKAGADLEKGDARTNSTPLIAASHLGKYDMVKILLDAGANINAENNLGSTALILASAGGYDKIVRLLLDRGANVNAVDKGGGNAFIRAILGKHEKIGYMLLDAGARPDMMDPQ